jgi:HK97 family phage portal protein
MNIFDRWLKKKEEREPQMECIYSSKAYSDGLSEKKAGRVDQTNYEGIGRTKYASGQPPQIYKDAEDAYKSFPIVRSAIDCIADSISSLGIKVNKVKGGQITEQPNHAFYDVFRNPNPRDTASEFLESVAKNLDTYGNCFIQIEKVGGTVELYVMITKYVAIIPDKAKKVKAYKYIINGNEVLLKPEEVIHIKFVDPTDPYYGSPVLSSAKEVLNIESNRLKFASAFFKNSAIPPAVLETDGYLAETTLGKLRGDWHRMHQGSTNFGRIAILTGGLKFKPLASPIKDMDFSALKELSNSDILSLFRIPPSVLGDQKDISGDEGKGSITAYWRSSVIPRVRRIEDALNKGLKDLVFGGGAYRFEFDLKNIAALQDDKESIAKYLATLVGSSIMTGNEGRAVVGLPKSTAKYMDEPLVANSYFGEQLMPLAQANSQGAGSNQAKPSVQPQATPAKPKPAAKPPKKELEDLLMKLKELNEKVNSK